MTGQFSLARIIVIAIGVIGLAACGTATGPKVIKTLHLKDYNGVSFSNILVIGVASDYSARAQFERTVVAELRRAGTSATAYHKVLGHNPPLTRSDITSAVRARGFDAVLLTRVKGQVTKYTESQGAPVAKQSRRPLNDQVFNVFRYDYEELNDPVEIRLTDKLNLVTELYAADSEEKVWAIETVNSAEHMGLLIDKEAVALVRELKKDGKIGP